MLDRPSPRLAAEHGPDHWLGVNYWSRSGGPDMWQPEHFDPDVIRSELETLAAHGVRLTRSFLMWPLFAPTPWSLDEGAVERYVRFLDLSDDVGIGTIPTFLVGHMSGENRDPDWVDTQSPGGRDLYHDGVLLAQQSRFVRTATQRLAGHPAIVGWLLSNEMPLYGGQTDRDGARAWAEVLVAAVRAGGGTQPVSLGDGAWGLEATGHDNGFRLRDAVEVVDWIGPHVYPVEQDEVRQLLTPAFVCELAHVGLPVVLEEFGATSSFGADDAIADYYRVVLHSSLLAGATGWVAWNNTDFDLPDADPYRHHPFEQRFGLTDARGRPKPALDEMARFGGLLDAMGPETRRLSTDTAIVVSSYLEVAHPMTDAANRPIVRDAVLQAYAAARAADLTPAIAREVDGVPDVRLLLVPSVHQLTAPGWRALEERAEAGATVYVSYCAGVSEFHPGLWHGDVDGFFGVRHQLRYGLREPITGEHVEWQTTARLGSLPPGHLLDFRVGGPPITRAMLPVEPVTAEVVAVDGDGRPALTRRPVGDGAIFLGTAPTEYMAASLPRVNPDDHVELYRALAVEAGAQPSVAVDDPFVCVDRIDAGGRTMVMLLSLAARRRTVRPAVARGALHDLGSGSPRDEVELPPYGVVVLEHRGDLR